MKAWQLIEDPLRWTQRVNARDAVGRGVAPSSLEARKWCAHGALLKVYAYDLGDHKKFQEVEASVTELCVKRHGKMHMSQVNDQLGHSVILSILKELDV